MTEDSVITHHHNESPLISPIKIGKLNPDFLLPNFKGDDRISNLFQMQSEYDDIIGLVPIHPQYKIPVYAAIAQSQDLGLKMLGLETVGTNGLVRIEYESLQEESNLLLIHYITKDRIYGTIMEQDGKMRHTQLFHRAGGLTITAIK